MDLYRGSVGTQQNVRTKGYPGDLREAGDPNDPAFDRPLVVGRISDGVVEVRDKETGTMVRHEVAKKPVPSHPVEPETPDKKQQEDKPMNEMTKEERIKRVAEMYNAGKSYKDMAETIGMSRSAVVNYVNAGVSSGVIKAKRGRPATLEAAPAARVEGEYADEASMRIGELGMSVIDLRARVVELEERLKAMEERLTVQEASQPGADSQQSSDLQALWKPFAEAFTAKTKEIESIREQMRELGITMSDYFPTLKSENLPENGRKRGTDVA